MIRLNIDNLIQEKNLTKYWLCNQLKFDYTILNNAASVPLWIIEELCLLLECTPNDLFVFTDEPDEYKV